MFYKRLFIYVGYYKNIFLCILVLEHTLDNGITYVPYKSNSYFLITQAYNITLVLALILTNTFYIILFNTKCIYISFCFIIDMYIYFCIDIIFCFFKIVLYNVFIDNSLQQKTNTNRSY